jgi:hypothetical protein
VVVAPLRAQLQVMQIDKGDIPTPRNHTPPPIPPEDLPTNRRRGALRRAPTLHASSTDTRVTTHVGVGVGEFPGIARVDAGEVGAGEFVGDARAEVDAGEFVGDTRVGVGAGEFVDTRVGVGDFVGAIHRGTGLCEIAGIGDGTVGRIRGETVHGSDRDILCVAATHLDDCRIELDQLAVRILKAAPAVFTLSHDQLVTGAAGIARAAQHFTRHQQ